VVDVELSAIRRSAEAALWAVLFQSVVPNGEPGTGVVERVRIPLPKFDQLAHGALFTFLGSFLGSVLPVATQAAQSLYVLGSVGERDFPVFEILRIASAFAGFRSPYSIPAFD
jgi:hypothetical protein